MSSAPMTSSFHSPHIVAEKIISSCIDKKNGELSYRIKWEDSWLPEKMISCMFPHLLLDFKQGNNINILGNEDANSSTSLDDEELMMTMNQTPNDAVIYVHQSTLPDSIQSYDVMALNLTPITCPCIDIEPQPNDLDALNLITVDLELKKLLKYMWTDGNIKNERRTSNRSRKVLYSTKTKKKKKLKINSSSSSKSCSTAKQQQQTFDNRQTCEICGKVLSKGRLKLHKMQVHLKDGKFKCAHCDKRFVMKSDLSKHLLIHGESTYECQYCGQKFKQPAPYGRHLQIHTVEKNWRCDVCFQNFRFQGDLKKHCFEDHADIAENPQRCCVCKEVLKVPNSVYRHSVGHTGMKLYECEICGKKFKRPPTLQKHLQMHKRLEKDKEEFEQNGSFPCEVCGKEFQRKLSLNRHVAKHRTQNENNLEEFLANKELRKAISREKHRGKRQIYRERYIQRKKEKEKLLSELGIDPIAKTIDLNNIIVTTSEDIKSDSTVVVDTRTEDDKAVEYVVVDDEYYKLFKENSQNSSV